MNTAVTEVVGEYLAARSTLRFKTLKEYRSRLNKFGAWCDQKHIGLEHIKPATITQFLADEQATPSVQISYTRVIKGFLNWCTNEEDYEEVVSPRTAKKLRPPKKEATPVEIFTVEEVTRLMLACDDLADEIKRARNKAIIALLLDTGIRASEMCWDSERKGEDTGLKLDHLYLDDPRDPRIRVHGKGNKWREVGVGKKARRLVRDYLRKRSEIHTQYLFLGRADHPLTVRGLESILSELGDLARVNDCHPHKFRHTFAVNYLLNGGDLYRLMRLLGHTRIEVTQIYLRAISGIQARGGGSVFDNM